MAAPTIANPDSIPVARKASSKTGDAKRTSLRQWFEVLLREIFEGRDEFLGWTPD